MTIKRTSIVLFLIILSISLIANFLFFSNNGTTITIKNQTNKSIENLVFLSNDNREGYTISKLESYTEVSFKYELGRFNENAANLHHISKLEDKKTYNIIGYMDKPYSYIHIDIISISNNGELNIKVKTK